MTYCVLPEVVVREMQSDGVLAASDVTCNRDGLPAVPCTRKLARWARARVSEYTSSGQPEKGEPFRFAAEIIEAALGR